MKSILKPIVSVILTVFLVGFISCSGRNNSAISENPKEEIAVLSMNLDEVDNMKIIYTDNESIEMYIPEKDWAAIEKQIQSATYDSIWNRDDIMIKMVAPDYTIIISYKDKTPDENDWMMIWKDNGKVKYRNIWYILNDDSKLTIIQFLESLRTKNISN